MDISLIYPGLIIKVYNRWGQIVWISAEGYPRAKSWKGEDNGGRELPVDSYHYIIHLNNGTGRTMQGVITIIK